MQCELCGKECQCRLGIVDDVKMMLCPDCMKFGKSVEIIHLPSTTAKRPILERIRKPAEKDIYTSKGMDKELVSGWNELIKNARDKKGLTREELGFKIGERTVTISKLENGDLRPSDKMIEKLEKELGIKLVEAVIDASDLPHGSRPAGLTLGDFIKKEDE